MAVGGGGGLYKKSLPVYNCFVRLILLLHKNGEAYLTFVFISATAKHSALHCCSMYLKVFAQTFSIVESFSSIKMSAVWLSCCYLLGPAIYSYLFFAHDCIAFCCVSSSLCSWHVVWENNKQPEKEVKKKRETRQQRGNLKPERLQRNKHIVSKSCQRCTRHCAD